MPPANRAALKSLLTRLAAANGRDHELDSAIAEHLDNLSGGASVPAYTASVDRCLELLRHCLPDWHWHLGYGASGVLPYAVVARDDERFEAAAATVPLALLLAIAQARLASPRA